MIYADIIVSLKTANKKQKLWCFLQEEQLEAPMFKYSSNIVEVVSDYVYLGVTMMYSNKFAVKKPQIDQARMPNFQYLLTIENVVFQ